MRVRVRRPRSPGPRRRERSRTRRRRFGRARGARAASSAFCVVPAPRPACGARAPGRPQSRGRRGAERQVRARPPARSGAPQRGRCTARGTAQSRLSADRLLRGQDWRRDKGQGTPGGPGTRRKSLPQAWQRGGGVRGAGKREPLRKVTPEPQAGRPHVAMTGLEAPPQPRAPRHPQSTAAHGFLPCPPAAVPPAPAVPAAVSVAVLPTVTSLPAGKGDLLAEPLHPTA